MAQTYRICTGAMFVLPDGRLLGAGELVDLEDDVAQFYPGKLELVPASHADAPAEEGPSPDARDAQP